MNWDKIWEKEVDKKYIKFQNNLATTIEKVILKNNYNIIADVGCGPALVILKLAKKYPKKQFFGFDKYKPIIKKNKKLSSSNLKFEVASINKLPNKKFDLITCVAVLHYLRNPLKQIKILMKYLKVGGSLFINYPNKTLLYYTKRERKVDKKRFKLMLNEINLITLLDIKKKYNGKVELIRETKRGNKYVLIKK